MLKYVNYGVVFQEIPCETTLSINISHCPIHCLGCHSKYLWDDIGSPLDVHSLDNLLKEYGSDITCVCFMGGDIDPETINSLAYHVKAEYPNLKVGWYSGYNHISPWVSLLNLDYVKLGPYNMKLGGLKSPATNQRLYKIDKHGNMEDITSMFWNAK